MSDAIPQVTADNYFDPDLNMPYMSVSQFKDFAGPEGCEARALATIQGKWKRPGKAVFGVGHYIEMAVTGDPAFPTYCEDHKKDIYNKDGKTKSAAYVTADRCVSRLRNCPEAMMFIAGSHVEHQVPLVGEIEGVPWKGLADFVIECMKTVADLKAMKNFARDWSLRMIDGDKRWTKVPWFEVYRYPFQLWTYGKMLCQMRGWDENEMRRVLVGVDKQDPPDLQVLGFFNLRRLDLYAEKMLIGLPRVQAIKRGDCEPTYCRRNECAYCREHAPFKLIDSDVEI